MAVLLCAVGYISNAVFAAVTLIAISVLYREGISGLARRIFSALRLLQGVDDLIQWFLRREVKGFLKQIDPKSFATSSKKAVQIPEKGHF